MTDRTARRLSRRHLLRLVGLAAGAGLVWAVLAVKLPPAESLAGEPGEEMPADEPEPEPEPLEPPMDEPLGALPEPPAPPRAREPQPASAARLRCRA